MSSKSILVTGGAGYIGAHAALALMDRGERVVVLDDLSESDVLRVPKGVAFVEGSVGDAALVAKTIAEHDVGAVMHFAGFIRVDESMRNPEKYFKNNTENTRILVQVCREHNVEHFIFSSSAAVYGDPAVVPIVEDAPTQPINPYGESKLRAEKIIYDSGLSAIILRYFNVAGTDAQGRTGYRIEERPTHMIRSCIRALLEKREFTIFGNDYPTPDGTCIRDYIHVNDLARAHVLALDFLRAGGVSGTYNCGDGRGYSNLEVVRALEKVAQERLGHVFGPRREGDPAKLVADASRIQKDFNWKPEYALEDMIQHELAWVRTARSH